MKLMACCELMAFCMAMKTFPATCRGDEELLLVSWPCKKGGSESKIERGSNKRQRCRCNNHLGDISCKLMSLIDIGFKNKNREVEHQ